MISLPRLELCAALTLAKLLKIVKDSLNLHFERVVLWSDSTIALSWISTSPHELKTFIANRVAEIQQLSSNSEWRHVSSENNPADSVSRGQTPREFIKNETWKYGPKWLADAEVNWPLSILRDIEVPERKGGTVLAATYNEKKSDIWAKFSCWKKLLRTMAHCFRFFFKITYSTM